MPGFLCALQELLLFKVAFGVLAAVSATCIYSQVLDEIVKRGASPEYIRVLSITVATPALQKLSEKYPGVLWSRQTCSPTSSNQLVLDVSATDKWTRGCWC